MRVALLAGGTGGAKMAHGFQMVLPAGDLSVIVNVADDLDVWGMHVSPDIDSVIYTLAGLLDRQRGWGLAGETWTALGMLARYGEPTWFRIGDGDLATHVHRTRLLLEEGLSLTDAVAQMAGAHGVASHILPATDERVVTKVETDDGLLDFQDYFVRLRQEPAVRGLRLAGVETAQPTTAALEAVATAELIVVSPSNPLVSIGPILALPGMREALAGTGAPKVAVSPIVAGKALKGPADRMLADMGHEASAIGVARIYAGVVDSFVLDAADAALAPAVEGLGMRPIVLRTVMRTDEDRARLAREIVGRILPE